MQNKKLTSKDIARLAGMSQSTVSRCLNGSQHISLEAKRRVDEVVKKYNFVLNANARSLKTNLSNTIGIVFPTHFKDFNINMYYGDLFNYVRTYLEKFQYDLIALTAKRDSKGFSNVERIVKNKKVDGLIVIQSYQTDLALEELYKEIPCIFICDDCSDNNLINSVAVDHYVGGQMAAELVIRLNVKKVLCLTADNTITAIKNRTKGFEYKLNKEGFDLKNVKYLTGDFTFESGLKSVNENLQDYLNSDLVFAHNDAMALGVLNGLYSNGIKVPEDVMIIGYDDLKMATWFSPKLTTIRIPNKEIANDSCSKLLQLIQHPDLKFELKIFDLNLIERETIKKI